MATAVHLHRDTCESQGGSRLWSLLTRELPTILLLFNVLIKAVTHIFEMVVGDEIPSKDHGIIDWTICICLVVYAVAGVIEEMKLVRHPIFWYAYTILGTVILELQLCITSFSLLTMILINICVVFTTLVCAMHEEKRNLFLIRSNIIQRSLENPNTPATEV